MELEHLALGPDSRWALVHQGGDEASLWHAGGGLRDADALVRAATSAAKARGWRVVARVDPARWPELSEALRAAGWAPRGRRVEWSVPLPTPQASSAARLTWRALEPRDPTLARALGEAARGDPLRPTEGRPEDWLAAWSGAPGLVGRFELGLLGGAAVVVTSGQADPESGWCRIPYMGVLPDARRQGFGRAGLHRGLRLMQEAGGSQWSDGCAEHNRGILKVVAALGVRGATILEEWSLRPPARRIV